MVTSEGQYFETRGMASYEQSIETLSSMKGQCTPANHRLGWALDENQRLNNLIELSGRALPNISLETFSTHTKHFTLQQKIVPCTSILSRLYHV